jgi:hypothetical protein
VEPLLIMGALLLAAIAASIVVLFVMPALLLAGLASAAGRAPAA